MSRSTRRAIALLATMLSLTGGPRLAAGLLPGNIWPNPTLETDANADGVPNFWNRGGSLTAIDVWTAALSVSPTHSFQLNVTSTTAYGEWNSDWLNITGGTNCQFRYNLRHTITNGGPMIETNVPAGAEGSLTFVDNYTLTGGVPGPDGRYYRIRWVEP